MVERVARRRPAGTVALALMAGASGQVLAQGAPAEVAALEQASDEEIIVTGEKVKRSLQDTTTSVAVTTKKRIEEETLLSVEDLYARTANVAASFRTFTIRGIDSQNVSGGGTSGLASVYVDGAVLSPDAVENGPLELWDAAQVEILRGPQSTIQGRNALAGSIVLKTQDPTYEWSMRGRAIGAEYDSYEFAAAGGGPLIADELAFRIAAEERRSDGHIWNPVREENGDERLTRTIRGKLLFEPSGVAGLRLLATYSHNDNERGDGRVRTDLPNYWSNRVRETDSPSLTDTETGIGTLEASYQIDANWSLTGVLSWNRTDYEFAFDADNGPEPLSYSSAFRRTDTATQELRANFEYADLHGLVGAYHADIDVRNDGMSLTLVDLPQETLVGVLTSPLFGFDQATAEMAVGLYAQLLPVVPVNYRYDSPSAVETTAVFADLTYDITDDLHLHAGFRYDSEDNTMANDQTTTFVGTYPDPLAYPGFEPLIGGLNALIDFYVTQANASSPESTVNFEAFLPKVGVTYDWTGDISTSFIVQRGYRSGGAVINPARSSLVPYDAEYTWNYELAFRSQWLDERLTLNANVFYTSWRDQQVWVNLGLNDYDNQTENAGKSHLYGFEIEASWQPTDDLSMYASVGYAFTKFDEFLVTAGDDQEPSDLSGQSFPDAPRWTAAIGATYRWDEVWFANVNANYQSGTGSGVYADGTKATDNDARTLVNAKVGYDAENFAVYVFAHNLFDEEYTTTSYSPEQHTAQLGDPQTFGVQLDVRY